MPMARKLPSGRLNVSCGASIVAERAGQPPGGMVALIGVETTVVQPTDERNERLG
jgi:hypothetical protein